MIQVTNCINSELKELIDIEYKKIEKEFNSINKRIHHTNIYHKDWLNIPCKSILKNLQDNYNIPIESIISMGFISGQPGCMDQHFHVDYDGITSTYFVPLCDLTDKNGTEYLSFTNIDINKRLFEHIKEISDKYLKSESIIEQLDLLDVNRLDYEFKILNGPAYCMVYLPNYVLHRGRRNNELYNKIMFQIVIAAVPGANISSRVNFYDSELDEDAKIIERLLKSRGMNEV